MKNNIFWFRRDLRLEDNSALASALTEKENVIPIFIFDANIIDRLPKDDARVSFIYNQLEKINTQLKKFKSSLLVKYGDPKEIFQQLLKDFDVEKVYSNKDAFKRT